MPSVSGANIGMRYNIEYFLPFHVFHVLHNSSPSRTLNCIWILILVPLIVTFGIEFDSSGHPIALDQSPTHEYLTHY
jgi:predicted permease